MRNRLFYSLVLLVVVSLGIVANVAAASNSQGDSPGTVAQSYNAGPGVLAGMIVELNGKDHSTVIPAKSQDIHNMTGVVVPVGNASIVLSPPSAANQQVLVAAGGRYELLVSNQGGAIKAGDYLTLSALNGIGMKAGTDQPEVIGRAAASFDGNSNVLDNVQLKSSQGHSSSVSIGHIAADVRLAPNPLYQNTSNLPSFLAKAAANVVHKPVSQARVYISTIVVVATLLIAGSIFYGGIRGGITAIGRNPLAKRAISRGLVQAVLFGLIVFVIGMVAAYGILA